jgi:hypothetical protein
MRSDFQQHLVANFPSMLGDFDRRPPESVGLETPAGWDCLVEVMLAQLLWCTEQAGSPALVVRQLKAKMGCLSVEFEGPDPDGRQIGVIDMARAISRRTCDVCGSPGTTNWVRRGWLAVRCEAHWVAEATRATFRLPPGECSKEK